MRYLHHHFEEHWFSDQKLAAKRWPCCKAGAGYTERSLAVDARGASSKKYYALCCESFQSSCIPHRSARPPTSYDSRQMKSCFHHFFYHPKYGTDRGKCALVSLVSTAASTANSKFIVILRAKIAAGDIPLLFEY